MKTVKKAPVPAKKTANSRHAHAWTGTWDRPMKLDETKLHPFTVARMTDHNVKGGDRKTKAVKKAG